MYMEDGILSREFRFFRGTNETTDTFVALRWLDHGTVRAEITSFSGRTYRDRVVKIYVKYKHGIIVFLASGKRFAIYNARADMKPIPALKTDIEIVDETGVHTYDFYEARCDDFKTIQEAIKSHKKVSVVYYEESPSINKITKCTVPNIVKLDTENYIFENDKGYKLFVTGV